MTELEYIRAQLDRIEQMLDKVLSKNDRAKPKKRLPENHELDQKDIEYSWKVGMHAPDIREQHRRFCDYHLKKGSVMADWNAAWRTWCGNWKRNNQGLLDMRREQAARTTKTNTEFE